MAKTSKSMSFKNAVIDYDSMIITEINKDSTEEFDLKKIIKEWSGIEGLSVSFRKDSDLTPDA